MKQLAVILSLLAICGAYLFYKVAAYNSRNGEDAPLYSVQRYDPYGTAAVYQLLKERGINVRVLDRPRLDTTDTGVLIQVIPRHNWWTASNERELAVDPLAEWIHQGNTVIQYSRYPTSLIYRFGIRNGQQGGEWEEIAEEIDTIERGSRPPDTIRAPATLAELYDSIGFGRGSISLRLPMTFYTAQPAGWKPIARIVFQQLVSLANSSVVAGEFKHGQGKLIVVGSPSPILNEFAGEQDNLQFLLDAIGGKPVIFDEWSRGIGQEASVMGLLQEIGLIPLLVQLALLAMLYMWSTAGHRRNPDRGVARRRSSSEQIATLGYLYGKTLTPQLAFNRIHAEVQRRLTDALRCTPDQIASRIARLPDSIRNLYSRMQSRLAMARPSGGVVCRVCGYSLFANEPGRCPECGTPIQYEQVRLMAEAAETGPPSGEKSAVNTDVVMAEVLSASHQLAQEIKRERRAFR